jgi:hypothetical protein
MEMTDGEIAPGLRALLPIEPRCSFERFPDIAAVEAHILQVAVVELVQCEKCSFAFATDDGSGNPIIHDSLYSREQ